MHNKEQTDAAREPADQMMDLITVRAACAVVAGAEKPIHPATYYRGVSAKRYPAPIKVSPGVSRVDKRALVTALLALGVA